MSDSPQSNSILSVFRDDGWRLGNCKVRIYDRRDIDTWGTHFLEKLYDQCLQSGILQDLFCGMTDLSADAICSYLHNVASRGTLLVMCVDSENPRHDKDAVWMTAGFAFPTVSIGGFPIPNPVNPKLRTEAAALMGYGYLKPWWGTPESVVLGMLTLAYFFENHNLTAVHGQSYFWNGLTAKFVSQFGVRQVGDIPRFLATQDGKLANCIVSTLLREDFENYVKGVIRDLAAKSLQKDKDADDGQGQQSGAQSTSPE